MCEAGLIDLGEECSNEVLELTALHASDNVSVVHHGNRVHPVFPAIAALLHDVLEGNDHRVSTLAVFPQTRRGTRLIKPISSCSPLAGLLMLCILAVSNPWRLLFRRPLHIANKLP